MKSKMTKPMPAVEPRSRKERVMERRSDMERKAQAAAGGKLPMDKGPRTGGYKPSSGKAKAILTSKAMPSRGAAPSGSKGSAIANAVRGAVTGGSRGSSTANAVRGAVTGGSRGSSTANAVRGAVTGGSRGSSSSLWPKLPSMMGGSSRVVGTPSTSPSMSAYLNRIKK